MKEVWKNIKGFKGLYLVSNLGRVKSLPRKYTQPVERILKQKPACGYMQVSLCKNGQKRDALVHWLVAEAFVIKPDHLCEVNHKDLNKLNNCSDNLEWLTRKENAVHAAKHGRHQKRLNAQQVVEIKKRLDAGESPFGICRDYNVSSTTVYHIKNRRTWNH